MSNLTVTIDAGITVFLFFVFLGDKYITSQILSTVAGCTVYSFTVERQAYLSSPDMKYKFFFHFFLPTHLVTKNA